MAGFLSQSTKSKNKKKFDKTSMDLVFEVNKWFKHNIPFLNKFSALKLLGWANLRVLVNIQSGQNPSEKAMFYLNFVNNFVRTDKGPQSSSLAFSEAEAKMLERALDNLYSLLKKLGNFNPNENFLFDNLGMKPVGKDQIQGRVQELEKSLFYFDVLIKKTIGCSVEVLVDGIKKITNLVYNNQFKSIDCYNLSTLTNLSNKTCSFFSEKHLIPFDNSDLKFFHQEASYIKKPFICIKKEYYCFTPFYLLDNAFEIVKMIVSNCGEDYKNKFLYLENWMNTSLGEESTKDDDNPDSIEDFISDDDYISTNSEEEKHTDEDDENDDDIENAAFYDKIFDDYDKDNEPEAIEYDSGIENENLINNELFDNADDDYEKVYIEKQTEQKLKNLEKPKIEAKKPEIKVERKEVVKKFQASDEQEMHKEINIAINNFENEAETNKEDTFNLYYSDLDDEEEEEEDFSFYDEIEDNYDLEKEDSIDSSDEYDDEDENESIYEELDSSIQPDLFEEKEDNLESYIEDAIEEEENEEIVEKEPVKIEEAIKKEQEFVEKQEPLKEDGLMDRTLVNIINFMPLKDGRVFDYLTKLNSEEQRSLIQIIEKARVSWIEDKKDKVFSDKKNNISFIICGSTYDILGENERINNVAALMLVTQKKDWDVIELQYSDEGKFVKSIFTHVDNEDFSDRRKKAIQLLALKLSKQK
ncbi:MAG: hypothetical protein PHD05_05130 [Sphaerochaetaceae bacterium]|nr:hypothetical protein [Sphaerochaetaceae bacterium]